MKTNNSTFLDVLHPTNSSRHSLLLDTDDNGAMVLHILTIVGCFLVLAIGILGNLLVLIVFGSRFTKLKACEIFLTNLACADLLGSVVLPGDKLYELMGGSYETVGNGGCKMIHFCSITSISVSALTLIAISIDRYVIVRWPLRSRIQLRHLLLVLVLIWLFGGFLGVPYLMHDHIKLHYDNGTDVMLCRVFMEPTYHETHTLVTFTLQVVVPLIIMVTTYSLIIAELQRISRTQVFQNHERVIQARYKRNRKTVKLLCVVVSAFFICIAPVHFFYILYLYGGVDVLSSKSVGEIFTILLMIQMANSCINPIIYSKLHTSFRRTTLTLFCSCCIDNLSTFKRTLSSFASTRISRISRVSRTTNVYSSPKSRENGHVYRESPPVIGRMIRESPVIGGNFHMMTSMTPECNPRSLLHNEVICMSEIKETNRLLMKT